MMNFDEFVPSKNNKKILQNVKFDNDNTKELYNLLTSQTQNIDQCGTVYFKADRMHLGICGIGDLHISEMIYNRWNAVKNYCHDTYLLLNYLGDIASVNVNNYDNAQPQESKFNVLEEIKLAKKEIGFNADKTLGGVGGNHDEPQQGDRLKNVYMSAAKEIIEGNNIPYSPNAMLYVIEMPIYKGKKIINYENAYVLSIHGYGRTPGEKIVSADTIYNQGMGVINQYNRLHKTNIIPDVIFGGHFHSNVNCDYSVECPIKNKLGRITGSFTKTIRVRECSTFASNQANSFNNHFSDTIIQNLNVVDLKFKHNDKFNQNTTNDEPENVLEVMEFPILKRNSAELTLPAKIYQHSNMDFDLKSKIDKKYKKVQIDDLIKQL